MIHGSYSDNGLYFFEKFGSETTESKNLSPRSPTKSPFLVHPKSKTIRSFGFSSNLYHTGCIPVLAGCIRD